MDGTLMSQSHLMLDDAQKAIENSRDPGSSALCTTLVVCTRAICHEIAALREVLDSIDSELCSLEGKVPDQS